MYGLEQAKYNIKCDCTRCLIKVFNAIRDSLGNESVEIQLATKRLYVYVTLDDHLLGIIANQPNCRVTDMVTPLVQRYGGQT